MTAIRLRCDALGIARLDAGPDGGRFTFRENPALDTGALVGIVQSRPDVYRFDGANGLRFATDLSDEETRVDFVTDLLGRLRGAADTNTT